MLSEPSPKIRKYIISKKVFLRSLEVMILWLTFSTPTYSQESDIKSDELLLGIEWRPRWELRNGYRQLRSDTSSAAFFTSQRARINLSFRHENVKFYASLQDIRVLGQVGQVSTAGSFNVYEMYGEIYFNSSWTMLIGRQQVELDNGRLFSAADWNQASRAHDGINLTYNSPALRHEFMFFFNQTSERVFGTNFFPSEFFNYKLLGIHYFKIKLSNQLTLMTMNAIDGFQRVPKGMNVRGSSGGRLEYEQGNFYLTISGYYQYGKTSDGLSVRAYYIQPEVKLKSGKLISRIGLELLSGDKAENPEIISRSFVTLYGVAWKFMGNMDHFTRFPDDVKSGGLINPYLFLSFAISEKLTLRSDFHLFYLNHPVVTINSTRTGQYLGFEQDISLHYSLKDYLTLTGAFSYMHPQKDMEALKGGTSQRIPFWAYGMIKFKLDNIRFLTQPSGNR